MDAAMRYPSNIEYDKIPLDQAMILSLIAEYEKCFRLIPNCIKSDLKFIENALRINSRVIMYASANYRNDLKMSLVVVRQNGMVLGCLGDSLRSAMDVVTCAVKQNRMAFEFASDEVTHLTQRSWIQVISYIL